MSVYDNSAAVSAGNELRNADNIAILTHCRPDGDTSGSAYALCKILRKLGKSCYILPNPETTDKFRKYFDECQPPESFIPEYITAVDIAAPDLIPAVYGDYKEKLDLLIDHHESNRLNAHVKAVEESAAASGEIIREIAAVLNVALDEKMAEGIFVAIATDTGCFKYSNTRPESHIYAADAISAGADSAGLCRTHFIKKTKTRSALERAVSSTLDYYSGGRIAVITLTDSAYKATGASQDDIDGISSLPVQIDGVEIGLFLRELDAGIKCSVRTDLYASASTICSAFGGGGHARAAGCTINADLETAVKMLVSESEKTLV